MSDKVDEQIKTKRAAIMAKVCSESSAELFKTLKGTTCKVLFETKQDGYLVGYNEAYVPVYVKEPIQNEKEILSVRIIDLFKDGVLGEITN
jgi:tRNA A37 methylthiotransferase MiaB